MDLASLKLQLIQQIIATDDPAVLEKIRRILDEADPNVVAEGEAPNFKLEDRMYTADEVRAMLEEVSRSSSEIPDLSNEEVAELNASRDRYLRGEGVWYSLEELQARMKQRTAKE